jgi:hypothetical protein
MRIGQRIGLHKDGETLRLPPFETELRRRLWINISQLDSRAAELSGSGLSVVNSACDVKPSLRVNDCDLYPDMAEPPVEQDTATEMMCLLLRSQIGVFLKKFMPTSDHFDGDWSGLSNPRVSIADKDHAIHQLEQMLQERLYRHCDLQIPLHLFSSLAAKASICKITSVRTPSSEEVSSSFWNCLNRSLLGRRLLIHKQPSNSSMRLPNAHFQKPTPLPLAYRDALSMACPNLPLTYLRTHSSPDLRNDAAWTTVDEVYASQPEIIHGGRTRSTLCIAVRSLTLKAWEARELELQRSEPSAPTPRPLPSCVRQLRELKTGTAGQAVQNQMPGPHSIDPSGPRIDNVDNSGLDVDPGTFGDNSLAVTETSSRVEMAGADDHPVDWEQWTSMFHEFEMEGQWDGAFASLSAFPELQHG